MAGLLKISDDTLHAAIEEFAEGYGNVLALGDEAFYDRPASGALRPRQLIHPRSTNPPKGSIQHGSKT
jgi:hypothetical protein